MLRPRLFATNKFGECRDRDHPRLSKSCQDQDFFESLTNHWVKADNNNLKKELDIKSVAIQTATKAAKDAIKTHEKEFKRLETEIKKPLEYKILKSSEEKDLKHN